MTGVANPAFPEVTITSVLVGDKVDIKTLPRQLEHQYYALSRRC